MNDHPIKVQNTKLANQETDIHFRFRQSLKIESDTISRFKDQFRNQPKTSARGVKEAITRNNHRKLLTEMQNPLLASSMSLRKDESLFNVQEGLGESIDSSHHMKSEAKRITI